MSGSGSHAARRARLAAQLAAAGSPVALRKRTSSNLFRYTRRARARKTVDLGEFDHVLGVDAASRTIDVEGLATFESVVDRTLPLGLAPPVTPELKHITIGGACVGIGIESSGFRHGFVHDSLAEAEVLLGDGRVVTCTPQNDHADLFQALPNSYGTLGYIVRARMRLAPARRYVRLNTTRHADLERFLAAMREATDRPDVDFIEALFYGADRFHLILASFVDEAPGTADILREHVFYRLALHEPEIHLAAKDYFFRYDPEWFWNLPETWFYRLFRRYAPAGLRNSSFYQRYTQAKDRLLGSLPGRRHADTEPLIQDWEVPWDKAAEFIRYALAEVDLAGRPWIATPIRTPAQPTLYPVTPGTLYFNLGCYCQVKKPAGKGDYHYTKILDNRCFESGGIKMLYSSTFLDEARFNRIYNGTEYAALKKKYDPSGAFPTLYQKAVAGH